jgi:FMN reductase
MTALTIAASPAVDSRSRRIAEFVTAQFAGWGIDAGELHLRELPAEALLRLERHDPILEKALAQVATAAVMVIATPVYKAAYSGLLKAFLDLLPQDALKGKAILPIATAGIPAHALAIDYALKPVLSALGARYVLGSIYVLDHQVSWTPETGLQLNVEIADRLNDGMRHLANSARPQTPSPSPHAPADAFYPAHPLDAGRVRCWD